MTAAFPSRVEQPADLVGDGARRGAAHGRPVRDGPRRRSRPTASRRAPSAGGSSSRCRSPAEAQLQEVRQRDLGLLDRRVPALLPLEGDQARRSRPAAAARACAPAGKSPVPVSTGGHGDAAVGRASLVLQVHVAHERAERREARLRLLAELGEGVGRVPDDADPVAAGLLDERARGRRRREVAVRLEPDLDAACRAGGRAACRAPPRSSSRVDARSAPGCTRSPKTRMPDAPSSAASSPVRAASSTARPPRGRVRAVEEASACRRRERARPASASRAPRLARGPRPTSSGRAQSASSFSRKRSSTPS